MWDKNTSAGLCAKKGGLTREGGRICGTLRYIYQLGNRMFKCLPLYLHICFLMSWSAEPLQVNPLSLIHFSRLVLNNCWKPCTQHRNKRTKTNKRTHANKCEQPNSQQLRKHNKKQTQTITQQYRAGLRRMWQHGQYTVPGWYNTKPFYYTYVHCVCRVVRNLSQTP